LIVLKSPDEIEKIAKAAKIVAEVLLQLKEVVSPGMTTDDLNRIAAEHIRLRGGIPTFIGYRGYPKAICTSVNEEVVHGIPGPRELKEGDIVGIDCGVTLDEYVGDAAMTMGVGQVSESAVRLMQTTQEALMRGIDCVVDGARIGDIGYAVQSYAEAKGYSVVRDFVGHGIGRQMHEEPQVPNFGLKGCGPRIRVGMVLAIEPMLNEGTHEVSVLKDKWTVVTKDKKLSAHFEHTIACTQDGPRILSVL